MTNQHVGPGPHRNDDGSFHYKGHTIRETRQADGKVAVTVDGAPISGGPFSFARAARQAAIGYIDMVTK